MATQVHASRRHAALAGVLLAGAAVAVALGSTAGCTIRPCEPLFLVGFSGMLQLKTWLATASWSWSSRQVRHARRGCGAGCRAPGRRPVGSGRCTGGAARSRS